MEARRPSLAPYFVLGVLFGVVLIKGEVVSWYRMQEMFRFDAFHMYGVLGSAWLTAMVSIQILKRRQAHAITGEPVSLAPKTMQRGNRYWIGGAIFGIGWAMSGACPGPMFALIGGGGGSVYLMTAVAALIGAWTYAFLRPKLPH